MHTLYFVLYLLAAVCFLAGAFNKTPSPRFSPPWFGLFLVAVVLLIQQAKHF